MSSVVVLRKSDAPAAVGFSLWMKKMSGMESSVNVMSTVDGKILEQRKLGKGETKKKLCMCAPTSHPGSFRCRYHRATSAQTVKPVQDPAAVVARHFLKLNFKNAKPMVVGVKPQPSRFSKAAAAAATASELPR